MTDSLFPEEKIQDNRPNKDGAKHFDSSWNFLSLMYKSARIGDAKTAVLCAEILRQTIGEFRVVQTLNQLVGEDLHPIYYQKIYSMIADYTDVFSKKIYKGHNLWQSTYILAKSPKWYMDNITPNLTDDQVWNGKELEDIRQYINVELELHVPEKLDDFIGNFNFPTWTFDSHTRVGQQRKRTGTADLRLDGGWGNRYAVKRMWDKIVEENPNSTYPELLKIYKKQLYSNI